MTRLYNFLNEEVFNISKDDIDFLYKPLIPWVKKINIAISNYDIKRLEVIRYEINKLKWGKNALNTRIVKVFDSNVLKSDICKVANDIRPIKIFIGFVYPVWHLFKNEVHCGINRRYFLGDINDVFIKTLKPNMKMNNIKANIRHEITHWIDDTLNNDYMTKIYKTQDWEVIAKSGGGEIESTDWEIKAQVSAVDEIIRRLSKKIKDILTFDIIVKIMRWEHKIKKPLWKIKIEKALKDADILRGK